MSFKNLLQNLTFAIVLFSFANHAQAKTIQLGSATLNRGLIQAILAKELCSCIYVQRLNVGNPQSSEDEKILLRFDECLYRSALPISPSVLKSLISMRPKVGQGQPPMFVASSTPIGRLLGLRIDSTNQRAIAVYLGEKKGCRLLTENEIKERRVIIR